MVHQRLVCAFGSLSVIKCKKVQPTLLPFVIRVQRGEGRQIGILKLLVCYDTV